MAKRASWAETAIRRASAATWLPSSPASAVVERAPGVSCSSYGAQQLPLTEPSRPCHELKPGNPTLHIFRDHEQSAPTCADSSPVDCPLREIWAGIGAGRGENGEKLRAREPSSADDDYFLPDGGVNRRPANGGEAPFRKQPSPFQDRSLIRRLAIRSPCLRDWLRHYALAAEAADEGESFGPSAGSELRCWQSLFGEVLVPEDFRRKALECGARLPCIQG
jgi:hypothetical protein